MITDNTSGISLPDHPVRNAYWYQLFHRLPRGLLQWGAALGFNWAVFGCDLAGVPLDEMMRATIGGLCLIPFGIKAWEARSGIV